MYKTKRYFRWIYHEIKTTILITVNHPSYVIQITNDFEGKLPKQYTNITKKISFRFWPCFTCRLKYGFSNITHNFRWEFSSCISWTIALDAVGGWWYCICWKSAPCSWWGVVRTVARPLWPHYFRKPTNICRCGWHRCCRSTGTSSFRWLWS